MFRISPNWFQTSDLSMIPNFFDDDGMLKGDALWILAHFPNYVQAIKSESSRAFQHIITMFL